MTRRQPLLVFAAIYMRPFCINFFLSAHSKTEQFGRYSDLTAVRFMDHKYFAVER